MKCAMKIFFAILILGGFVLPVRAQSPDADTIQVQWTTFAQAQEQFVKKQKPIFIFFYAANDTTCARMLTQTIDLDEVANYLNILYYNVKIDVNNPAEMETVKGVINVGPNKQARFSAPMIMVLNKAGTGATFDGFKTRDEIFPILIYFQEETYRTTPYEDYEKAYFEAYPKNNSRGYTIIREKIKWLTMEEAIERQQLYPGKKLFVDVYANWNIGATVMFTATYNNQTIADIINKEFLPVRVYAKGNDTIHFYGSTFVNAGPASGNFHQFTITMAGDPAPNNMVSFHFPTFLIVTEEKAVLKFNGFFTARNLEPVLKFYSTNAYKDTDIGKFMESFKSNMAPEE